MFVEITGLPIPVASSTPPPSDLLDLSALIGNVDLSAPVVSAVVKDAEFDRIAAIARRPETVDVAIVEGMTRFLKNPEHHAWDQIRARFHAGEAVDVAGLPETRLDLKPEKPQTLRPIQARALKDAFEREGLLAPIGVGHGKFLISVLLVTLIEAKRAAAGHDAGRWLLLVPANLLSQTKIELAKARRHWRVPGLYPSGQLRVESYNTLSSVKQSKFLDEYCPTDIVLDEGHKLKSLGAARTKRFKRYFTEHSSTHLYCLSGTITRKTIRDYWHIVHLALPHFAPLPRSYTSTESWAAALDDMPDNDQRKAPGALLYLCDPAEVDAIHPGWSSAPEDVRLGYYGETEEKQRQLLKLVRNGYQRRLVETPGVVGTEDGSLGTSLVITERVPPPPPPEVIEAFRKLRATWQTPNGDEIDGGISLWRHACELASGFYYRWDPVAPAAWLNARQAWNRFVRYVLAHNRQRLDSPLQVWHAVENDELSKAFGDGKVLQNDWRAVRESFKPNPLDDWTSTWLVEDVIRWFDEQKDEDGKRVDGIAWVHENAVGRKIEQLSGGRIRYFGGGAQASTDILEHRGPVVASIAAHGTGKNLQRFARNLVVHPPSGGDTWEQLLGRTHRPGQEADEVRVDVYLHALELRAAFQSACRLSTYIQDSTQQRQKLTYASITMRPDEDVAALGAAGDPMWKK